MIVDLPEKDSINTDRIVVDHDEKSAVDSMI